MSEITVVPFDRTSPTEVVSRRRAKQLVCNGDARWLTGKAAIVMLNPDCKQGWSPKLSAGYLVLQLI